MKNFFIASLILMLASCSSTIKEYKYPKNRAEVNQERRGSLITGEYSGFVLGGDKAGKNSSLPNQVLWKASLEALSFMPLSTTDSAGGVIITDWYSSKTNRNEKVKVNVMILSNKLSASSLKITAFREVLSGSKWVSSPASNEFVENLKNSILAKAKEIHLSGRK